MVTKKDPATLDLLCQKTLQDNDSELIDQEQAEKIKAFMVKFSMLHLAIRSMGGYINIWAKVKEFYTKIKERKLNANSNRA